MVSTISQHGDTSCFVLALVLQAANQTNITNLPTPGLLSRLWHRAVTPIGVGTIFTRGTIPTGIAVTLVDVHLTVYTCMKIQSHLVLQHKFN